MGSSFMSALLGCVVGAQTPLFRGKLGKWLIPHQNQKKQDWYPFNTEQAYCGEGVIIFYLAYFQHPFSRNRSWFSRAMVNRLAATW